MSNTTVRWTLAKVVGVYEADDLETALKMFREIHPKMDITRVQLIEKKTVKKVAVSSEEEPLKM